MTGASREWGFCIDKYVLYTTSPRRGLNEWAFHLVSIVFPADVWHSLLYLSRACTGADTGYFCKGGGCSEGILKGHNRQHIYIVVKSVKIFKTE